MRRIILAAVGLLGLAAVAVPTAASASPATVQGVVFVVNNYWNNAQNTWNVSSVTHQWYLSPNNARAIYPVQDTSWQEYADDANQSLCMTLDWNTSGTDKILDEPCANHPSQLWASHNFGSGYIWYFYNQYLTPARAGCTGGHQAVIDAPSPTAGLTMRCVETNGDPLPEQLWQLANS